MTMPLAPTPLRKRLRKRVKNYTPALRGDHELLDLNHSPAPVIWALGQQGLSLAEKSVLVSLMSFMRPNRAQRMVADVTVTEVASRAACSRKTAQRQLSVMVRRKIIERGPKDMTRVGAPEAETSTWLFSSEEFERFFRSRWDEVVADGCALLLYNVDSVVRDVEPAKYGL